jgi:hypothetical protein
MCRQFADRRRSISCTLSDPVKIIVCAVDFMLSQAFHGFETFPTTIALVRTTCFPDNACAFVAHNYPHCFGASTISLGASAQPIARLTVVLVELLLVITIELLAIEFGSILDRLARQIDVDIEVVPIDVGDPDWRDQHLGLTPVS